MKKIVSYSAIATLAVAVAVSCSKDIEFEPSVESYAQTLIANTPNADTRVSFEENSGTKAIDLAWEETDSFSVYEVNGKWVADYKVSDLASSKFEAENGGSELEDNVDYIAVYPARPDSEASYAEYAAIDFTAKQSATAESLTHLNAACQMSDEFKKGDEVSFAHNKAIMTITFDDIPTGEAPTKVEFSDGLNKHYALELSGMDAATDETTLYTVYMMIDPAESVTRDLTFVVTATNKVNLYNVSTKTEGDTSTAKEYKAGYRYTAPISNQTEQLSKTSPTWQIIGTADDLVSYLSGTIINAVLTADIDMVGKTITAVDFLKVFDGNGKKISNLTIDDSTTTQTALFKSLKANAVVKNLTMVSPKISGKDYVGAISGKALNGSYIINCAVVGGELEAADGYVGGISGQCQGVIRGCSVDSSTKVTSTKNVGGIVGISSVNGDYENSISDCRVAAALTASGLNSGGIVGNATSTIISNCVFSGSLTSENNIAGGVVGVGATNPIIYGCVNNGTVIGLTKVGGIVGAFSSGGNIVACYNSGVVGDGTLTASSGSSAGIIAEAKGTSSIIGCYNTNNDGNITKGYIVGYVDGDSTATATECYFTATPAIGSYGTQVSAISDINDKVEAMNTAINTTSYNTYNYVKGLSETDSPTLIEK